MTGQEEPREFADESVESGRHDGEQNGGRDKPFEITINYNGLVKPIDVNKDETIGDVRTRATALFGITDSPHVLGLFPQEGAELSDTETVKDAKVKKGDQLLLRQSAVRAG